ncbi:MAG: signal peptidase [Legionellales bacterium]|nr:signal peptidase [Legionellales bacterium]
MKKLLSFMILCFGFSTIAIAASTDPVVMLDNTSSQMINALKQNKATIKSNPKYVEGLAKKILIPNVDVPTMSRLALGRNAWQNASNAQKKQFMQEFVTLLVRTYSTALASYTNQSIKFYPVRGGTDGKSRVQVMSKIIQPGGPSIPISYRLVKRGSYWKVYDMSVDGVSLVQSFKSQFANEIAQGGMSGLLASMQKHNQTLAKK